MMRFYFYELSQHLAMPAIVLGYMYLYFSLCKTGCVAERMLVGLILALGVNLLIKIFADPFVDNLVVAAGHQLAINAQEGTTWDSLFRALITDSGSLGSEPRKSRWCAAPGMRIISISGLGGLWTPPGHHGSTRPLLSSRWVDERERTIKEVLPENNSRRGSVVVPV